MISSENRNRHTLLIVAAAAALALGTVLGGMALAMQLSPSSAAGAGVFDPFKPTRAVIVPPAPARDPRNPAIRAGNVLTPKWLPVRDPFTPPIRSPFLP